VVAEDSGFEKNTDAISATVFNIRCESFKHPFHLAGEV
jgi:hypothetical protein